jgi:integrase
VSETFVKRHVEANKLRTQADIKRVLAKYVLPEWQHRPFREIKRGDVANLLDKIEDKHGERQADITLAIIRKMTNWYATRNDNYQPPVVPGMGRNDAGDRKRKRILNDDEIRALWKADGMFGAIVKVLLLTAQRRDKVKTMKWADISGGIWTIATEAREKANAGSCDCPKRRSISSRRSRSLLTTRSCLLFQHGESGRPTRRCPHSTHFHSARPNLTRN